MHVRSWPITCYTARPKATAEPGARPAKDRPCSRETGHIGGDVPKSVGTLLISTQKEAE